MITPHRIFGVFEKKSGKKSALCTKNLTPGKTFFLERLTAQDGVEYREWDAQRSKLAAFIMKGASNIGLRQGSVVLYLGASHGYTTSFVSDLVGAEGFVFALDFSPRTTRDLVFLCEQRTNIAPILADANHPEEYVNNVPKEVDVLFMDIAQRNQEDIFVRNVDRFLKKNGFGLLAIKAKSIDIKQKPKAIFEAIRRSLEKKYAVVDFKLLDPFEKDHALIMIKK